MMHILQRKAPRPAAAAGQRRPVAPVEAHVTQAPAGLHYAPGVVQRAAASRAVQRVPDIGGQALPAGLRGGIESLSGMDMSGVRVHYGSSKPAQLDAHAYAQGSHIHLARGQEKHLPHEAWHVVQQRQGRVPATMRLGGTPVNDQAGLEREADTMGRRASETPANPADAAGMAGPQPASAPSPVAQRVPLEAKVSWSVTHVVQENGGSLFHGAEIGEEGELQAGDKLVVDSDDVIASRRGGNQEVAENREADSRAEPGRDWYRVLILKGRDVRAQSLYVRAETITRSDSTNYLENLVSASNMSGWNAGNPDLANAHHKFPKSAIGWLYDHMSAEQRAALRLAVFLPGNAGPTAIARLRSLLIAPRWGEELVSSDNRVDDPHNNRGEHDSDEAFLDLVHQTDGSVTPRSQVVQSLAGSVVKQIYLKYRLRELAGEADGFVIDDADAEQVIAHFRHSEELHYAIEDNPRQTSHSSGDAFVPVGGRYAKTPVAPVAPVAVPGEDLSGHYVARQGQLREKDKTRKEIIQRFFEWLGKDSKSEKDDLIKSDFAGRKGWILRYIHGDRRGKALRPQTVDPFWLQKLRDYLEGKIPEDQLDEQMPWLQSLFMNG